MQVLLVTGGQQWSGNSTIPLDSTEILETNTWRISAPLPTARYGLRAASLENTIFLFGGSGRSLICSGEPDGSSELNTILKFDATNQTWENVGEMGEKRSGHTVTYVEDVSKLKMFSFPLDRLSESFDPPLQC